MSATGKFYRKRWARRDWLLKVTVSIAAAMITFTRVNGTEVEFTGTISQAEPTFTQDGTPAHPYSDANKCPAQTDLIFWPSGRLVPTIPASISVCFVGDQPFERSGPNPVELRDR